MLEPWQEYQAVYDKLAGNTKLVGIDISDDMLDIAKKNILPSSIHYTTRLANSINAIKNVTSDAGKLYSIITK